MTDHATAGSAARQLGPAAARAVADMKVPAMYPALKTVVAGRDTTTWLERWTAAPERLWHVLDRTGNLVGALTLPPNVILRVASRDAVWAVETDEDGLQSVVRYRVVHGR